AMPVNDVPRCRVALTRVEEFLKDPPAGFSVEVLHSGRRVHSDPERSLVLIDDFDSCGGTVVFHNSQYVLSIDGSDPFIKSQMERGLDWTISSVAGESYSVDSWVAQNLHALTDESINVTPVWRNATFTLKYCSDALFDFPYWFGFSKRTIKVITYLAQETRSNADEFSLTSLSAQAFFFCLNR
uniref:Uncharacterized protein n=1 Tax=Mola mola TaxID=94237 RepID=A0A3Q4B8C6_MOLML